MPLVVCSCGHKLDAASELKANGPRPEPGNLSVCIYCGRLRVYTDDLTLRELTDDELDEIMSDPETAHDILLMRRAIRDMQK
jgi:hypothetical protein